MLLLRVNYYWKDIKCTFSGNCVLNISSLPESSNLVPSKARSCGQLWFCRSVIRNRLVIFTVVDLIVEIIYIDNWLEPDIDWPAHAVEAELRIRCRVENSIFAFQASRSLAFRPMLVDAAWNVKIYHSILLNTNYNWLYALDRTRCIPLNTAPYQNIPLFLHLEIFSTRW